MTDRGTAPEQVLTEQERARGLARMKTVATGLLVLMAFVFVLAHLGIGHYPALGYLRAFAEAAMVGALADWFAVTALFRHPLGLPIPHTAIIPTRKDQIGESLANFVHDNFLTAPALEPRLADTDFALRLGSWLAERGNARKVADDGARILRWLLTTVDSQVLRDFMRDNLSAGLRQIEVTPLLGRVLDLMVTADHHQKLMDTAVNAARETLDENRFSLRMKIATESPWWVPRFVDEEIYDKIVNEIERGLIRIGTDEDHEARQKFNVAIADFVDALKNDPEIIRRGEKLKEEALAHPAVQRYLADIWTHLSSSLREQADNPRSVLHARLIRALARLGETMRKDPELREDLNRWARDIVLYVVAQYRGEMASVISETVRAWDPVATSRRVELQVGRDLQFIRINGTLVGGLAGLAIYSVMKYF